MSVGLSDLPLPQGDPGTLWLAAARFASVGSRSGHGVIATQGAQTFFLNRTWAGAAFDAARHDSALLAIRIQGLSARLPRAAAALSGYADALDTAQRTVVALQTSWDEAQRDYRTTIADLPASAPPGSPGARGLAHDAAAERSAVQARLGSAYAGCVASLAEVGDRAAAALRALSAEAAGPGTAVGAGTAVGSGRAALSDTGIRDSALSGLGLVTGRFTTLRAEADAHDVAGLLELLVAGDVGAVDDAAALIDRRVSDPVFAQALMAALPPERLSEILASLVEPGPAASIVDPVWLAGRSSDLVSGLGVALTTAANPARSVGLDPATTMRLTRWRSAWLPVVAASVGQVRRLPDGTLVGGGWVQGQLLAGAARRGGGHSPGALYAATVGLAMVEVERRAGGSDASTRGAPALHAIRPDGSRASLVGPQLEDALLALEQTLRGDVVSTRAFLLQPVPGEADVLVIDHLVHERFVLLADDRAAGSMTVLGQLVVEAGSDPQDLDSMHLASRFVNAVGATALTTDDAAGFRRAMSPALHDLATVVGAHPDALGDVLDGTAQRGTDDARLGSADRLVQDGRRPGTHDIVFLDRAHASAVLGTLAFDHLDALPPPGDPDRAPALAHVTSLLVEDQRDDLVRAVVRDHAGDTHALDAAATRLGRTVGFVMTSAGDALAAAQVPEDARNAAVLALADKALAKVPAPPVAGPAGPALMPYVRLAASNALAHLLPTDAEATQRAATESSLARAREDSVVAGRSLVSQAAPWTAAQSPQTWAATTSRPVAPFWGADGRPRPEETLETAQLRSFNDWRRDMSLSVYDTTPQTVRDAVLSGADDARDTKTSPG